MHPPLPPLLHLPPFFRFLILLITTLTVTGCATDTPPKPPQPKPTLLCYVGINMRDTVEQLAKIHEARTGVHINCVVNDPRPLIDAIEVAPTADLFVCHDPFLPILIDHGIRPKTAYTAASLTPVIAVRKGNPKNIQSFQDLARPGLRIGLTDKTSMTGNIARLMARKAGVTEPFEANVAAEFPAGRALANSLIDDKLDAGIIWNIVVHIYRDKLDAIDIAPNLRPTGPEATMYAPALGDIELDYVRVTVASLASTTHPAESDAFARFVASPEATALFLENGFSRPNPGRPTILPNRRPASQSNAAPKQ